MTGNKARYLAAIAVAVVTLALPLVLTERQLTVYVLAGLATMVTAGISLLMGYAGQVSLGQAAFYAIGAYTAGLMGVHGAAPIAGLLVAPVVAGVAGLCVAVPLIRLRGHHLAFATLAVQLIVLSVAGKLAIVGGDIGLQGIPQFSLGGLELSATIDYAYLTWIAAAAVLVVSFNIIRSRPGRGLRALATSESAAASAGVPAARYRIVVFVISAAFAGLAGSIYAFFLGYVAPSSFPVLLSIEFVVMAVVGGLGTMWGALVGVAAITVIVQTLNQIGTLPGMPTHAPAVFSYAVYAILLIVVLRYLPAGLVPAAATWLSGRRGPGPERTGTAGA